MEDLDADEHRRLRRVATAVARDAGSADPELVADEVLERLLLAPEPVEERAAWLRVAARRLAIDEHRARERRGGPTYGYGEGSELRGPDFVPSISAEVRRRLLVEDLLGSLSTRDANLVRDWADGWTPRELAEAYGMSATVVSTTLSRIKSRLAGRADRDDADLA